VGYDRRRLRLEDGGFIGEGAAGLERHWWIRLRGGVPRLVIGGAEGVTMVLRQGSDGIWRGRWERHERMPVELIPKAQPRTVDPQGPGSRQPLAISVQGVRSSGYGRLGIEVIRGLLAHQVPLYLNDRHVDPDHVGEDLTGLIALPRAQDWHLVIAPPHLLEGYQLTGRSVVLTTWESEMLLPGWVAELNKAALVLVLSRWNRECFRRCGVATEVQVVPAGLDPAVFHYQEAYPDLCTFGFAAALGAGGVRKNLATLLRAFAGAFPHESDVRLRIKLTPSCQLPESVTDPRIDVIRAYLSDQEMGAWYSSLTAFVNPSHAEGWGLHLLEAMATGRALISTPYSGVAEYFDETVGYPVTYRLTASPFHLYPGQWAEPDRDSLIQRMRQVYENGPQARQLGQAAAARAREFSWQVAHQRLVGALRAIGAVSEIRGQRSEVRSQK
jgi:glycosyltransferase involved in cell wall biosynthesis